MGSDPCRSGCRNYDAISIHAPRMGSDSPSALPKSGFSHFNPRSPDGERLPVSRFAMPSPSNFNPRSPDGERLTNGGIHCLRLKISIHAPRMGSDLWRGSTTRPRMRFQSTLPGWGATFRAFLFGLWGSISIHAPRMGSDRLVMRRRCSRMHFNPRSPDGERRSFPRRARRTGRDFNPRSPDGERPARVAADHAGVGISIHAPRMGSDFEAMCHQFVEYAFQSTLPGWGATAATVRGGKGRIFQSTLPGWGATHGGPAQQ